MKKLQLLRANVRLSFINQRCSTLADLKQPDISVACERREGEPHSLLPPSTSHRLCIVYMYIHV